MDVGSDFSHYRVIEHIGRGGMADVWSARDTRLSRTVAVKTIARDLSQDLDPIKLFEREAQTIAALEHPHILPIYEFGEYEGQLFIVMRYVSGGSLEDVIEAGPLPVDETLRITRAVGQALGYAHASSVIHLDLKPSNILLDSYRSPYLADFGLATMLGPEGRAANPGSGTLLYMAPEQVTADVLDRRADIYSFAILVFHMLTGQLPFDAAYPLALKQLQQNEELPDVRSLRPGLPEALNEVLRRASKLELAERTNSMDEVIAGIDRVLMSGRVPISLDTTTGRASATASAGRTTSAFDQMISGPLDGLISGPIDGLITGPLASPTEAETRSLDALITGPLNDLITTRPLPSTKESETAPLDALITGPIDGLISKPVPSMRGGDIDSLITGPIDGLVSRKAAGSGNIDSLITGPIDGLVSRPMPLMSPEELARREALDIYQKARRAYARGQGRFLLGVTDYILIASDYAQAEQFGLELDDAGLQMLLRGALEYDYELDFWWGKLDDDARRWTALHALRGENAAARERALLRLAGVPDAEPPIIPKQVAQALQVEPNRAARKAALDVLAARAPKQSRWQDAVYSPEIDAVLADQALDTDAVDVAALAAQTIGRIRSAAAVAPLAQAQQRGDRGALRALALVRDQAGSLPGSVSSTARIYAWLNNTGRRLADKPMTAVWRFIWAFTGAFLGFAYYAWVGLTSSPGWQVLIVQIYAKTVTTGLTIAFFTAIRVILADELWQRLRGFWPAWIRTLLAGLMGFLMGTIMWGAFTAVLLEGTVEWGVCALGGLGIGIAYALMNLFRMPGWLSTLVTFLGLFVPAALLWAAFINGQVPVPLIYLGTDDNNIITWLVPTLLLTALGVNAQALARDVRGLLRRGK
ncbi:MAG TPA: serine/threonine-protein kinase [Candidatus Limnocylindrales bacterium]|nr:serine/threonine-protein kinase [Candidatus Limnocylindrales bacterium]